MAESPKDEDSGFDQVLQRLRGVVEKLAPAYTAWRRGDSERADSLFREFIPRLQPDLRRLFENAAPILGQSAGAPERPQLLRKAIITSLVAAVLWLGFYFLHQADIFSFRRMVEGA